MKPVVPQGKTAVSIAICPCRTRVNARFSSGVGVPKCCSSDELLVQILFGFAYPCPGHVCSTIEELRSGIAQVDLFFLNNSGIRWAGLVMDDGSIRSCGRDRVER
jgi:hypothetical protein